jgi:PDZ domain
MGTEDLLNVKILRDGDALDLQYRLDRRQPLVPVLHGVDCIPSYFVVGGLVFVPLSIPFLEHAYGGTRTASLVIPLKKNVWCVPHVRG